MRDKTIVTLDLGATKCAAGVIQYHHDTQDYICQTSCHLKLTDTTSLIDLIRHIEQQLGISFSAADAVCIGAAGQYNGRELCHLAGAYPYPMRFADIAQTEHWPNYAVIHDYDTVVCATFTSYMHNNQNLLRLNDCMPDPHKRRVALGLGTGLGMKDGVLLPSGEFWLGKNEIGHIGIIHPAKANATRIAQHQGFIRYLQTYQTRTDQQITFENILTGRGMVHLHEFLYPHLPTLTPAEASQKIEAGAAPELLDLFAWYLGLFIGSVQLIFMPEGGIWITGGVVIKNLDLFKQASLQEGIDASPAYQHERQSHPLGVMTNPQHALIGAAYYAVKRLLQPVTYPASSLP
jgi:glucokinase